MTPFEKALRIAELYREPWSDEKHAEWNALGMNTFHPHTIIETIRDLLREVAAQKVDKERGK